MAAYDFCNLRAMQAGGYSGNIRTSFSNPLSSPIMNVLSGVLSSISPLRWIILTICALGIAAIGVRTLETEKSRTKRAERKRKREIRALTERISTYARAIHQRYPTADVVVSERDLAEQLRKRPEAVVTALNLLLNEQKVQRAPLNGYWRLNA